MKIHHFAMLFAVVALAVLMVLDLKITEQTVLRVERRELDLALCDAVDAGALQLLSAYGTQVLEKEEAVEAFFKSLYASFAVLDAPTSRQMLEIYVPVVLVTDTDGFYVNFSSIKRSGTGNEAERIFSDKEYYEYSQGALSYRFTNKSYVTVIDSSGIIDGTGGPSSFSIDAAHIEEFYLYEQLKAKCPDSILLDFEAFERVRDNVISQTLNAALDKYCNAHNAIASEFGMTYEFSMPQADGTLLLRAASGVSVLALLQGYPYHGGIGTYNRFSVSNAHIKETSSFYLDLDELTYHRYGCNYCGLDFELLYDKEECAKKGAFACEHCCPNTGVHRNGG